MNGYGAERVVFVSGYGIEVVLLNGEVVERVAFVGDGGSAKFPGTVTVILTSVVVTLTLTEPRKIPADIELSDLVTVWKVVALVENAAVMVEYGADVVVSLIKLVVLVSDVVDDELSDKPTASVLIEASVDVV